MFRQATIEDLPSIAKVHSICFPDSFLTQLGKYQSRVCRGSLLEAFYLEYLNDNPELFVVADNEDVGVVGFCMGYYMDKDDQMKCFLHKNRTRVLWKTILLLILGNKQAWKKVILRLKHKPRVSDWTTINEKYDYILNNERGDLLSVCVLPEYRGKGYAQGLMDLFLAEMKGHKRNLCLLSVKTENSRARRFYERNGFEIYRKRGEDGLTYIKLLA